jgi:hypothetical protein
MRHSREKLDDAHLAKVLTGDEARRMWTQASEHFTYSVIRTLNEQYERFNG